MYKSLFPGLVVLLFTSLRSFASDTTYRKSPWLMSGSVGYTSNRAFGPMLNYFEQEEYQQFPGYHMQQKDRSGYELRMGLQKKVSQFFYFKTGLGFLQQQVNPEEGGFMVYKDSLKTGYLSVPVLFGADLPVNRARTILLSLEGGASGDFRLVNNTKPGIDRDAFSTPFAKLAVQGSVILTFAVQADSHAFIQYTYAVDVTPAYNETLDIGSTVDPVRTFAIKYKTQVLSLGWQWEL